MFADEGGGIKVIAMGGEPELPLCDDGLPSPPKILMESFRGLLVSLVVYCPAKINLNLVPRNSVLSQSPGSAAGGLTPAVGETGALDEP